MGAYLEKPVTKIQSETGHGQYFEYAAASMQGWRVSQEDAHTCIPLFDVERQSSLFGVYDGHGGSEVSKYCKEALPNHLKGTAEYALGDMEACFRTGFLSFDASLKDKRVKHRLWDLSNRDCPDSEDVPEDFGTLLKEASMPLSDVMAGYNMRQATGEGGSSAPDQAMEAGSNSTSSSDSEDKTENTPTSDSSRVPTTDTSPQVTTSENSQTESMNGSAETSSMAESNGEVQTSDYNASTESSPALKKGKATAKTVSPGSQKAPLRPRASERLRSVLSRGLAKALVKAQEDDDDDDEDDDDDMTSSGSSEMEESEDEGGSSSGEEGDADEDDSEDSEEQAVEDDGEEEPGVDSGSTAVVALLTKEKVMVANIGDSRAILGRLVAATSPEEENPKLVAVDLSHDHKPELPEERERIELAGGIVDEEGRINGGLNLSRAFGDHSNKTSADLPPEKQKISPMPDIVTQPLNIAPSPDKEGDVFLFLACDGIWNEMSSEAAANFIWQYMEAGLDLEIILKRMFRFCLASDSNGDGSGCDNMTAILVKLTPDGQRKCAEKMAAKATALGADSQEQSDSNPEGDVFTDDTSTAAVQEKQASTETPPVAPEASHSAKEESQDDRTPKKRSTEPCDDTDEQSVHKKPKL